MKSTRKKKIIKKIKAEIGFSIILKRFFISWLFLIFFALIVIQQDSFFKKTLSSPEQVVFVLPGTPSDWGIDENIEGTHGAASDWSYLFEDGEKNQNVYIIPNDKPLDDQNIVLDDILLPKDYIPEDEFFSENSFIPGNDNLNKDEPNYDTGGVGNLGNLDKKPCKTPWGQYLADSDFVLAYQQRKDVNNLCNVQKRYCNDGKLSGFYSQKSCKENSVYSFIKPEAISYTQKPIDPLIQSKPASLSGADFDIHGKINHSNKPIDVWGDPSPGIQYTNDPVSQNLNTKSPCNSPWGGKIKNGQFVKAYKSSIGLLDLPCEVEIRLCVGGNLKGSYSNRTCTFKKMTYRDYLINNYDLENPTIGDLVNGIDTEEKKTTYLESSFWKWLGKHF